MIAFEDESFEDFPEISKFKENIAFLKNTDFTNFTNDEIGKMLFEKAKILISVFGKQEQDYFNNQTFYRARLSKTISEEEDLSLIRTYSYPSPNLCKYNGRANVKGKSVFYCSNMAITSILETKPSLGDEGYLSLWKSNSNRQIKYGTFLSRNLHEENPLYLVAKNSYSFFENFNLAHHPAYKQHLDDLYDFISEQFVIEKEPYPITSFLSTNNLYGEAWKDFIVYPSIASDQMQCNFAFHPNAADRFLSFQKVIRFKIVDLNPLKITTGRIGEINNNNIEWRTGKENEFTMFGTKITPLNSDNV